jgi:hypothetical protein
VLQYPGNVKLWESPRQSRGFSPINKINALSRRVTRKVTIYDVRLQTWAKEKHMAYPLEMSVREALAVMGTARPIAESVTTDDARKASGNAMMSAYPDFPTPTLGSQEKLFAAIKIAHQVGDVDTLASLHVGIANTVVQYCNAFLSCCNKSQNLAKRLRYLTWWCQILLDFRDMTGNTKVRKAA